MLYTDLHDATADFEKGFMFDSIGNGQANGRVRGAKAWATR